MPTTGTVKEQFEGQRCTVSGLYTADYSRRFTVSNVAGTIDQYRAVVLVQSTAAPWSVHPNDSTGALRCVGYDCAALGPNTFDVTVNYVNTKPKYYSGGVQLEALTTDLDRPNPEDAEQIRVSHNGDTIPATVDVLYPCGVLTIRRWEAAIGAGLTTWTDPLALAFTLVGKINATDWVVGAFTYPAETVMCENITFDDSRSAGIAWDMQYEFRLKPNGWQPVAVYIDSETGYPPSDAAWGVGRKRIDYYYTYDFNTLLLA